MMKYVKRKMNKNWMDTGCVQTNTKRQDGVLNNSPKNKPSLKLRQPITVALIILRVTHFWITK